MSVQALSAVLKHSQARLGDRLVLIAIANYANQDGENAFPSLETIGRDAHLSVRQVIRCVERLEKSGELLVQHSRNKPNLYRIHPSVLRGDNLSLPKETPLLTTKPLVPYGSSDISRPDLSHDNLSLQNHALKTHARVRSIQSARRPGDCEKCHGSKADGSCWCVAS